MFVLFDIGGTNMRVGASADGQTISQSKIIPTPQGFTDGVKQLKQIAQKLSEGEEITGVAGGIAGALDKTKSILVASPHLTGWVNQPLKVELERIFDCRVELENDANLNGLGEAVNGSGKGKKVVAMITLGTGVGGARIVDSKLDKNIWGFEPGHQVIIPEGNLCNCGGKGHLEAYVAGSYLEKIYQKKAEDIKDDAVWDQIAKYLSIGLNNLTVFWSPEVIILGGSMIKSLPFEKVRTYLKAELKIFPTPPKIVLATLGDEAGLYGALELLK
ncbi:ROK family protein [Candidatus Daviesbacteria bacterium]|nr:ROK family protein [Candidatus Daviesbacteria bacterium]